MAADTGQGNGVRAGAATRADAGAGQRRARSACVCAIRVSWLFQRRAAPATGPCSLSDRAVPTQRDTGTDSCTGTAARRAQRRDAGLADGVGTMSTTPRGGPLQGVRVLELTKVWAGPYAGKQIGRASCRARGVSVRLELGGCRIL